VANLVKLMLGWFGALKAPLVLLSIGVGIILGLSSYTFHYAEGLSYLSNDPRACVNCHIMRDEYDGWQKASHHAVATCNDCHTPHTFFAKYWTKAENGFFHSRAFTFQDFHEPILIKPRNSRLLQANCVNCHRDLVSGILGHDDAEGGTASCVRCHAQVGHGPTR
jgi:cytochrome c nitrite reductase small subunit